MERSNGESKRYKKRDKEKTNENSKREKNRKKSKKEIQVSMRDDKKFQQLKIFYRPL